MSFRTAISAFDLGIAIAIGIELASIVATSESNTDTDYSSIENQEEPFIPLN